MRHGGRHCDRHVLGNFSFAIYVVFSSLIAYLLHVFSCLIADLLQCLKEHEVDAAMVLEAECKRLLQNLRHEARV